jgi:hypothetical protein
MYYKKKQRRPPSKKRYIDFNITKKYSCLLSRAPCFFSFTDDAAQAASQVSAGRANASGATLRRAHTYFTLFLAVNTCRSKYLLFPEILVQPSYPPSTVCC